MKRYMNKKNVAVLALMPLLLTTAIGGTVAYLTAKSDTVENKFTPSTVTTSVEETLTGGVKKDVMIQNTGDTEAYIRAAVVVTWKKVDGDDAGNVYGTAPVEGTDYTLTWSYKNETPDDLTDDTWIKGSDGFYYHKTAVAADPDGAGSQLGGMTEVLFTDCQPVVDKAPAGYTLNVEIIASGIQSKPAEAVEAWSNGLFTISDSGLTNKTTGEGGN